MADQEVVEYILRAGLVCRRNGAVFELEHDMIVRGHETPIPVPTYFVGHPDGTFSPADPQPVLHNIRSVVRNIESAFLKMPSPSQTHESPPLEPAG